jgi:hypothetical protein
MTRCARKFGAFFVGLSAEHTRRFITIYRLGGTSGLTQRTCL